MGLSTPTYAQQNAISNSVAAVLRQQDNKLRSGEIAYFQETIDRSPPMVPKNLPPGTTIFEDQKKPVRTASSTVSLVYTPQKFVRHSIERNGQGERKEVFDGKDLMVKLDSKDKNVSNFTTIKKGADEQSEAQRSANIYPGACAIQGRGLSFLPNYRIVGGKNEPVLECRLLPDKNPDLVLTAYLDPAKNFLAKRIEWRDKNALVTSITLTSPRLLNSGVWVADKAHMEMIFENNIPQFERQTKILSARMYEPKDDVFQIRVTQGMLVEDSTSGTKVILRKTSPGTISKEEFLSLSRQHEEQEARIMARAETIRREQRIKRVAVNAGWAVVFASLIGITIMLLRRRKGSIQ